MLSLDIWSEKEILHIKKLQSLITNNTSWFDDKTHKTKADLEMQDDEITLISYTWREYAIEELGWNDKLLYLIAGDPNDLNSRNIAAVKAGNSGPMEPGDEDRIPDCNCTPAWMACSPHDCSDSIECTQTDSGCGWVWVTKCTGRCEP